MPPKANRQPKRAQDSTLNPRQKQLGLVDRVHLPALQDTPSSRRQYSYGAAVEPIAPRRFTGDYADKPYNLQNAIGNALERQAREIEAERMNLPQTQLQAPQQNPVRQSRTRAPAAAFPPPRNADPVAPSEADDVRSFGIESDVYGDATIASTPDISNDTGLNLGQRSVNRRDTRRRRTKEQVDPAFRDAGSEESSGDELGARRSTRRRRQSAKVIDQQQDEEAAPAKTAPNLSNGTSKATSRSTRSQSSGERSPETRARAATARATANQLAPKQASPNNLARYAQLNRFEAQQQQHAAQTAEEPSASDRSEQDSALQEDIQEQEDAAASESDRESDAEDQRQKWQQRWDYLQSLSPSRYLQRNRQVPVTHDHEDENEASPVPGWRMLLNLQYYVETLRRFFTWISEIASDLWEGISRHSPSSSQLSAFVAAMILFLAVAPVLRMSGASDDLFDSSKTFMFFNSLKSLSLSDNFRNIIPTISHPFKLREHVTLELSDFLDDGKFQIEDFLKKFNEQFGYVKSAGAMNQQVLEKLNKIVPNVVHMNLDNGRPVVAQEFWYALRELIHDEESIFTVPSNGRLPEKQWKLVSSRILDDAGLQSKLSSSVSGAEDRLERKISSLWDTWVKENGGKLQSMLSESVEKLQSLGTDEELNARIARIIQEQRKSDTPTDGVFVTKDEFMKHLKNEFAEQGSQIRAHVHDLQPRLERYVRGTIENLGLDKNESVKLSDGARAEVSALVNKAISDALANVNIEAFAGGKIQNHWDSVLKNQINFFSMGSGATINPKHSSATYDPYGGGVVDRRDLQNGLRGAARWHQSEALMEWSEDGDKWCAAREFNLEGKPHGYMLAVQLGQPVIPQHIVVEHILPGATIDPKARPRDIEVYAQIEDPEVRERVLDFSATHIPAPSEAEVVASLEPDMVLIDRFTYLGAELHDGVYVRQLNRELVRLGAETSEVVIRALNNYGAPDHTCFYRVRMYGETGGSEVAVDDSPEEKSFWQRMTGSLYGSSV
ncbi:hypothetical protein NLU13_5912 [Sarocladium strictum]|uniref:SUN domain-containing protein n=1 Tax=Sarocladium strictum TaxID=5046 RepID=A0AA39L6S5_SARSR|nr:hypothetical protein NLU13_5912 [Sarocladium strictum]